MKKLKQNRAITLVALVITIIILLILAGITISQLTGSGLFENSKLAKEKYENAQAKEDDMLKQYENMINNSGIGSTRDVTYCTTPATTTSTASITNPCVVIENYRNGKEWYRVWSDGWIEQGGHATAGDTSSGVAINLLKQFTSTNYTLNAMMAGNYNTTASRQVYCVGKYVDKFYAMSTWANSTGAGGSTYVFDWYACGY